MSKARLVYLTIGTKGLRNDLEPQTTPLTTALYLHDKFGEIVAKDEIIFLVGLVTPKRIAKLRRKN
jgi:hypothetical protein